MSGTHDQQRNRFLQELEQIKDLLDEPSSKVSSKEKPKPTIKQTATPYGANPFLPPHIKQRLNQPAPLPPLLIDNQTVQTLVDQLVAQHLPSIEAELRRQLLAVAQSMLDKGQK